MLQNIWKPFSKWDHKGLSPKPARRRQSKPIHWHMLKKLILHLAIMLEFWACALNAFHINDSFILTSCKRLQISISIIWNNLIESDHYFWSKWRIVRQFSLLTQNMVLIFIKLTTLWIKKYVSGMNINKETALLLNHSLNPFCFWNTSIALPRHQPAPNPH